MSKWAIISLAFLSFSAAGCNIEVHDGPGDWDDDDWNDGSTVQDRAEQACQPYCLQLIHCGVLSDSAFSACTKLCEQRYVDDEESVAAGCECVSSSSCNDENIDHCDGDPIPGVWTDGDDAMSGGDGDGDGTTNGAGGGSGQTPDGPSCQDNHQCAAGDDCIDGTCLSRCAASCQCADGMACEDGYCKTPEEPKVECESTCDCTAGDECVSGYCQ